MWFDEKGRNEACGAAAPWLLGTLAVALVSFAAAAQQRQAPVNGDLANGRQLFGVHCAICHGFDGRGNGPVAKRFSPPPIAFDDGAVMNARDDSMLRKVIEKGCASGLCKGMMPGFGSSLNGLDVWDIVVYLRTLHVPLRRFFPRADRFLVKKYRIGSLGPEEFRQGQMERLKKALGKVSNDVLEQTVFTLFRAERPSRDLELVPQEPRRLAELKKENKLGYVFFMEILDPRKRPMRVALALDRNFAIKALLPLGVPAALERELGRRLERYVGLGKRGDRFVPPRSRDRIGKWFDRQVSRIYAIAVEAANSYEFEERERSWADGTF
ncbi:MAG: hypothetical protein D6806_15865 [Deltaproteobacteria bacterium]|nr:MAG: hypothetical protein D6806_15865 [Deltaproteobacteria bacterium]